MEPRLKPGIYVRALIRRAEVAGAFAAVLHKGAEEAGAVLVALRDGTGQTMLYSQARAGAEGNLVWMRPLRGPENDQVIRDYVTRQTRIDPDLWVVEIDDAKGRSFLDEPVL